MKRQCSKCPSVATHVEQRAEPQVIVRLNGTIDSKVVYVNTYYCRIHNGGKL